MNRHKTVAVKNGLKLHTYIWRTDAWRLTENDYFFIMQQHITEKIIWIK